MAVAASSNASISTNSSSEEFQILASDACDAAEKFVKIYYDALDKHRSVVAKVYMDTATLSWDGTPITGQENIYKFIENLPTSSHVVESLDCQPVPSFASGVDRTILVLTNGTVKFHKNRTRMFNQTFVLMAQHTTWKVVSDCYRTFETD